MSFPENLQAAIEAKEWSNAKAARALDIGPSHMSRILSGDIKPGLALIKRMCAVLEIAPNDLINTGSVAGEADQ